MFAFLITIVLILFISWASTRKGALGVTVLILTSIFVGVVLGSVLSVPIILLLIIGDIVPMMWVIAWVCCISLCTVGSFVLGRLSTD